MLNFKIQSTTRIILLTSILSFVGCTENPYLDLEGAPQDSDNSLTKVWTGTYNGVPNFDEMTLEDLKPALNQAMAINLIEIENIANQSTNPNFDNTIVALERTGKVLDRVFTYYGIWSSNLSSPEFRNIQQEMAPIMSAFFSKISQNQALFNRVKAVYENLESSTLRADQQRLVKLTYNGFARNGATLSEKDKKRYTEINQRLAELHTQFGNNVLVDEENYVVFVSEFQLGGLPSSLIRAAAAAAEELGKPNMYAITNTRSSMAPFLTFSEHRSLRQKVWSNYYSRGDNGDQYDNNKVIAEILNLRHERVGLLGYDSYAQWRLEDRMAKNPENAMALLEAVWPSAIARVSEEVADMQAIADTENTGIKIEPWDYRYYAEKVRKDRYQLDSDEVKQYLQLDKLNQAMFFVASELFNFTFTAVAENSVPTFHPDVKVWEVTDKISGEHVGLWYLDPFARKGKRSGAWATSYRSHTTFEGNKTVLSSNNSNFVKAPAGQPVLISWDDATTFFHEFGHALHSLSSSVEYPSQNGGVRDYTEFQSQLLERWLMTDEVINNYLVHHQTGEPIPKALVKKIKAAATFNQGFATTEYLASAIMDLKFHTTDPSGIDPDIFERKTLAELNMPKQLVMRHRSPHFGHVFSGEGYSSGYYGYMWADVLTSDAAEAFAEAPNGFYDQDVAERLVKHLFTPRNAIDPGEAYRAFRGRDADIKPLMRDRGFPIID
ncbi:M3 family metallopeptidase [Reinekea sp.]|jgi:peptidyl-dipeptidase Dcp|uniref:M3 family metallopeptidase n=1 Tax=Reinekea sp. TaxID=1970455 RepID=UPI0019C1C17C|nr:M3 family metallopeptidase [SAR92 clade bacterium]MDB9977368.1 M3 family metallopeptidase [Porticoccaceae bacterium]|tara:strand:+ start:705 stop:2867 length:2163 start_codon:yes stop_codon:yes gene_type:complete